MQSQKKQINVFISKEIPDNGIELLLKEGFAVNVWLQDRQITQTELAELCENCDALICTSPEKIDSEFLSQCTHLDIISQFAAGYDNIDIAAASNLGILIANTPAAMTEATADIAFGLMIATARRMFYMHEKIAKGEWGTFKPKANLGMELKNKVLGVFGLGKIGTAMAERCKGAYHMPILYCNRNPHKEAEDKFNAKRVSFDELLRLSDVLSVHAALSPETKGIFNRDAFSKMKRDALFINTSRGALHNESDLIEAIENEIIGGAGLDVTNPEPMSINNKLLSFPNVCVLPHIGSATVEARNEMSRQAAMNIIAFYNNQPIPNLLNQHVQKKPGSDRLK